MRLVRATLIAASCLACLTGAEAEVFQHGAVAADHPLASEAGAEILRLGGNAIDAAVATSFALSVVRPQSCGIGGGGFMVVYLNEDPRGLTEGPVATTLCYREQAPAAVGERFFEDLDDPDASRWSGHAVGVPGTVAGLLFALERYGTLDRRDVLQPAIRLATEGFFVDDAYCKTARSTVEWFEEDPDRKERSPFLFKRLCELGDIVSGDIIRNPEQGSALQLIADLGAGAFYDGPIGAAIVGAVQGAGGLMTMDDLARFNVRERAPLEGEFKGRRVLAMPPPSSGGVATLQMFGVLEQILDSDSEESTRRLHNSASYLHALAESMKHAFADRARWLGDDDFSDVPLATLLSDSHTREMASLFDASGVLPSSAYGMTEAPPDDSGTSHFSVIDAEGNAVACTETINLGFGSRLTVEEFGFCLNNEMDDFTTVRGASNAFGLRQSAANLPVPGKRPLSSMTPTIVLSADGEVEAVLGGSGGPRIITGVAQVLLNAVLHGMSAEDAVSAPRVHHQWSPNILGLEEPMNPDPDSEMDADSIQAVQRSMASMAANVQRKRDLLERGHTLGFTDDVGVVQLILRRADGTLDAASDPRKGGRPAGD